MITAHPQEKDQAILEKRDYLIVHLLTMTIVWLHRITTTADEDQDNCFNNFQYLER